VKIEDNQIGTQPWAEVLGLSRQGLTCGHDHSTGIVCERLASDRELNLCRAVIILQSELKPLDG
jgi:hypothetical protein